MPYPYNDISQVTHLEANLNFCALSHQRPNQFRKYLKYAVGEIILVVLGILIALQINNWNNNRIESDKISSYAKLLIEDLERDIQMVRFSRRQAARSVIRLDSLILYVQDREIQDISNLDFLCLSSSLGYRPFSWSRATLEEMKGSGSLQYIEDDDLKMKIANYDAFTYHLDQDHISDSSIGDHCGRLRSEIINKNYKNLTPLLDAMGSISKRSDWEENFMVYARSDGFNFPIFKHQLPNPCFPSSEKSDFSQPMTTSSSNTADTR